MKNKLFPDGGDDNIQTPLPLACAVIQAVKPWGHVLEPFCGEGNIMLALSECSSVDCVDGVEIREEVGGPYAHSRRRDRVRRFTGDFLDAVGLVQPTLNGTLPIFVSPQERLQKLTGTGKYDWAITNPPWSMWRQAFAACAQVADNIAILSLINAAFFERRMRDRQEMRVGMRRVIQFNHPPTFTGWRKNGAALAVLVFEREGKTTLWKERPVFTIGEEPEY